MDKKQADLEKALVNEGFTIVEDKGERFCIAYGEKFTIGHPFSVYAKLFRKEKNATLKYDFMKKLHDYLWPNDLKTWHYWTERRFKVWCEGWRIMSWAGGGSIGKSLDAAKIVLIEELCNPKGVGSIIVSTTLEGLTSRVYGYLTRYIKGTALEFNYQFLRSAPPKILFDRDDIIHSISAVAAAKGSEKKGAISNYIGRHPRDKLILILDEAPDLDPAILDAIPNLESGQDNFQVIAIGNSASKFDLHGALSTPIGGWNSIDPMVSNRWETTQQNGICLFFSCYESPAIYEQDPLKREALSKFLITQKQIDEKKKLYGETSDSFYRFVLGFWKSSSTDETVISREFLEEFNVFKTTEWAGLHPLNMVAGLDPSFSTGGDGCVLRLAILGQDIKGGIVLDFRGEELIFNIRISAIADKSAEIQIADEVLRVLKQYNCPLENLVIDGTGSGRGLAEVLKLRSGSLRSPTKIISVRSGGNATLNHFDSVVKSAHDLWFQFRDYIQHSQIRGLDNITAHQLTSRLCLIKNGKLQLEPKKEYRERMGAITPSLRKSPDEADAASLALQSAIINFGFTPGQRRDLGITTKFEDEKYFVFMQGKKRTLDPRDIKRNPPGASFKSGLENYASKRKSF